MSLQLLSKASNVPSLTMVSKKVGSFLILLLNVLVNPLPLLVQALLV
jgi:hypothetical protein